MKLNSHMAGVEYWYIYNFDLQYNIKFVLYIPIFVSQTDKVRVMLFVANMDLLIQL